MQLPPDLAQFTGRAALVARITAALGQPPARTPGTPAAQVPVIGLTGAPGVGKTTLAVHAAHQLAAQFPDGQFFVDLGPVRLDGPPAAALDVLGRLLRGIGVGEHALPVSVAERAALWRSETAGRRVLLVLDGAPSAAHVQQVLPGARGPAVLLTAGRRLFGPAHARWLKVDVLPDGDALALLAVLVGAERVAAEPAAARRLAGLTAGLPHALHAMAERLVSRPWWSLASSLERLSERDPGAAEPAGECAALSERYGSVWDALRPRQARALRLLAMPEGPDTSLPAAAAVLGLPVPEAQAILESLADAHLLEAEAGDRCRFLYPIRVYARSRALRDEVPAARDAALARLAAFYAATVRGALLSVEPGLDLPPAGPGGLAFRCADVAREWLRAERRQFEAVAAQSATGAAGAEAARAAEVLARLAAVPSGPSRRSGAPV